VAGGDGRWKILIIALVIMVLFGSEKLPSAARSLGQPVRILTKEAQGLGEEEPESRPPGAPAAARAAAGISAGAPGEQPARPAQAGAPRQRTGGLPRAAAAAAAPPPPAAAAAGASRPARQPV